MEVKDPTKKEEIDWPFMRLVFLGGATVYCLLEAAWILSAPAGVAHADTASDLWTTVASSTYDLINASEPFFIFLFATMIALWALYGIITAIVAAARSVRP